VDSVGLVSTPPLSGSLGALDRAGFQIQNRHIPDPEVPSVDRYIVSPGYFEAVGIPLLRGRTFRESDAGSTNAVAIISQSAAQKIFRAEDPLGSRIQLGGRHDAGHWAEIVGVVADVHQYGLDSPATPQAYLLHTQFPYNYAAVLMIRSTIPAAALAKMVEEQIWSFDKSTLVFNPAPETVIRASDTLIVIGADSHLRKLEAMAMA
jgi:putative ABC transport system permease protein